MKLLDDDDEEEIDDAILLASGVEVLTTMGDEFGVGFGDGFHSQSLSGTSKLPFSGFDMHVRFVTW